MSSRTEFIEKVMNRHRPAVDSRGEVKSCTCGTQFGVQHQQNGIYWYHLAAEIDFELTPDTKDATPVVRALMQSVIASSPDRRTDDWHGRVTVARACLDLLDTLERIG